MKINLLGYALIIMILVVAIKIYLESDHMNLRCILSGIDGKR